LTNRQKIGFTAPAFRGRVVPQSKGNIVTTESGAASAKSVNFSTQRNNPEPQNVLQEKSHALSLDMLGALILENLKLLLIGPLVVGVVAFGIASALPKWYTSTAYLSLDEAGARSADSLMRSTPVLEKVLAKLDVPRDRRSLDSNRRIVVAPGEIQVASKLFRQEYSDRDPRVAQKINALFIEAWLDSTKPRPERRRAIEAEIERRDLQAKSISQLLDRLQKDATSLVTQSQQGELATPMMNLIEKRDDNLKALVELRESLNGISSDVVFGPADLPTVPSWPKKAIITILTVVVSTLLLLVFVILRRFWFARNTG
jgi:uncharacterized protein involved in exopolysaccharide biosynthesis